MTAERRALLGDHKASKRLSEAGVLVRVRFAEARGCSIDIPNRRILGSTSIAPWLRLMHSSRALGSGVSRPTTYRLRQQA